MAEFDADVCRAFTHPAESVTVSADDMADLLAELWAMGYCWPLVRTPKSDDVSQAVLDAEVDGLQKGYSAVVDLVHRLSGEMDDGWFCRALIRKGQREKWAAEDAAKQESQP